MLLAVQAFKLWLGPAASPMALLVPPTLLLAEGLGTAAAWPGWRGLRCLAPAARRPLQGRLLLAAALAAAAAVVAGRQRNRAQLLQLAVLLPTAALVLQWLLVQAMGLWGQSDRRLPDGAQLFSEALLMGGLVMAGLLLAPWWRVPSGCSPGRGCWSWLIWSDRCCAVFLRGPRHLRAHADDRRAGGGGRPGDSMRTSI